MIKDYIAIDLETTGLSPTSNKIIEIGAIKVIDNVVVDSFSEFVNPKEPIPGRITEITGINDDMVTGAKEFEELAEELLGFIGGLPLLGHNITFDYSFLKCSFARMNIEFESYGIDTLMISKKVLPELPSRSLSYLCGHFDIDPGNSHRAYDDANSAKELYELLLKKYEELNEIKATKLTYSIKKESPATPAQIKYLRDLIARHNVNEIVNYDTLTKSHASRLIDGIISQYGKI